jgi:hypothetical protein
MHALPVPGRGATGSVVPSGDAGMLADRHGSLSHRNREGNPMHFVRIAILLPFVALTFGCGTTLVPVRYQAAHEAVPAATPGASVIVGKFVDSRGTDANWLGSIRGGYGNRLKDLRTPDPTSHVVEAAFSDALRARQLLGEAGGARFAIEGSIAKFDCNYFMNREAHVQLIVTLVSLPSRALLYSATYRVDRSEAGVGAGIFADVNYLGVYAEKALSEAVDQAIEDRRFAAALSSPAP